MGYELYFVSACPSHVKLGGQSSPHDLAYHEMLPLCDLNPGLVLFAHRAINTLAMRSIGLPIAFKHTFVATMLNGMGRTAPIQMGSSGE